MTKQRESGITWTEETWNPIRGCSRISKGCMNCYAEGVANRFKGEGQPYEGLIASTGQWNGTVKLVDHMLTQPIRWKRPRLIFCNSMSDLFHESLTEEQIDKVFSVMAIASHHTFQVLTKRAERMAQYLSAEGLRDRWARAAMHLGYLWDDPDPLYDSIAYVAEKFLPNVWLGVSVEDQAAADERIPFLLSTPAAVRWISAEPLIGPIDLEYPKSLWPQGPDMCCSGHECGCHGRPIDPPLIYGIDWVVVGGESGAGARPMHPDWARSLRDQCVEAGVPLHFKQWGSWEVSSYENGHYDCNMRTSGASWVDIDGSVGDVDSGKNFSQKSFAMIKVGKKKSGRLLDGRVWDEYPVGYEKERN